MTIYLYKKTHKVTGLKYLGTTNSKNPYRYKGSGTYWRFHCDKHGYDIDTEILFETDSKEEIKSKGLYYSELWNVVESKEWANLKPEEGNGGGYVAGSESAKKRSAKMIGHPGWLKSQPESAKKLISKAQKELLSALTPEEMIARMKNSCCHPDSYTAERSNNISKALAGSIRTTDSKKKQSESRKNLAKNMTEEERKQFFGGHNKGKPWSEARRAAQKKKEKIL